MKKINFFRKSKLENGSEILDPKPRTLPVGIRRKPTQEQRFMAILNQHRQQMATDQEYIDETDFNIDEPDILSAHEHNAIVYDMEPEVPAPQETSTPELEAPAPAEEPPT
jgi:hypothetical protein